MSVASCWAAKNRIRKPENQVNTSSGVPWRYELIWSWNVPWSTVLILTGMPVVCGERVDDPGEDAFGDRVRVVRPQRDAAAHGRRRGFGRGGRAGRRAGRRAAGGCGRGRCGRRRRARRRACSEEGRDAAKGRDGGPTLQDLTARDGTKAVEVVHAISSWVDRPATHRRSRPQCDCCHGAGQCQETRARSHVLSCSNSLTSARFGIKMHMRRPRRSSPAVNGVSRPGAGYWERSGCWHGNARH